MSKPKPFKTQTPRLSDATIARIRATAHTFVCAGGSIFPHRDDEDRDEHIGNIDEALHGTESSEAFSNALDAARLEFATRERLCSAAVQSSIEHAEAAFLFGAFVGLETAALTFGPLATVPTTTRPRPSKARK
jgi:hypothetical protein